MYINFVSDRLASYDYYVHRNWAIPRKNQALKIYQNTFPAFLPKQTRWKENTWRAFWDAQLKNAEVFLTPQVSLTRNKKPLLRKTVQWERGCFVKKMKRKLETPLKKFEVEKWTLPIHVRMAGQRQPQVATTQFRTPATLN